jgi:16S rRNA (cytosine967-C5)-methyltransferase
MALSPARVAAFEILLRVEKQQAYAAELLHSERLTALSTADRSLCTELVMGVLRWRLLLDQHIARFSFTPFRKLDLEVLSALRLGAYQIEFLERVPARAAINESVELVKHARKHSAAPLANAVLRKLPQTSAEERARRHRGDAWLDSRGKEEFAAAALAHDLAHPQWLVERWMERYGPARAAAICACDQQVPATTVRLRPAAASPQTAGGKGGALEEELRQAGLQLVPGQLMATARRVTAGDPTHTGAYLQGRVAIQDEASQLIAALVGTGQRILDCCAAPGGKTSALADRNPGGEILALELHEHRARVLHRMAGAANVRVIAADARIMPVAGAFDRILTDVPCSGTGTLARNPEIKWRLKPEDIADLRKRQVAILRAASSRLAPGGRLVYASCSLEPEENESVIEEVLSSGANPVAGLRLLEGRAELERLRDAGELVWPDIESLLHGPFLRTLPGVHPCDGFFAAIVEKEK